MSSSTIRVFVSYDREHDRDLHDRLAEEAADPGSGFEIAACSEGGAAGESWEARTRRRIQEADEVVVLCGEHVGDSPRVGAELRIAREEERPYFLLWGRRELMCTKPMGAKPNEGMYSWTPEILRTQITTVIRNAREDERVAASGLRSAASGAAPKA